MGSPLFLLLLLSAASKAGKVIYSNGPVNGNISLPLICEKDNSVPEK